MISCREQSDKAKNDFHALIVSTYPHTLGNVNMHMYACVHAFVSVCMHLCLCVCARVPVFAYTVEEKIQ